MRKMIWLAAVINIIAGGLSAAAISLPGAAVSAPEFAVGAFVFCCFNSGVLGIAVAAQGRSRAVTRGTNTSV